MDHPLTCNNLKCRKQLADHAVVTSCSHIFCSECAKQLGFTQLENQGCNTCPACNAQLAKADSIFFTNLNPTEEYKACILSGLNPSIVMECAGRAVGFWAYQITQNLHYQQHLCKTLQEKYSDLWTRCDQINRDADAKINGLRGKLESMTNSRDILQQKNVELAEALRDKNRKLYQTQELYTQVKRKAELSQIERAAYDAVDNSIRLAPQPATNGEELHGFHSSFHDTNEPVYTLSHGPRFDTTGFATGLSGSNLQRNEREDPWARKRTPSHGLTPETQPYRRTTSGQGRADIFPPNIASNKGLSRGGSIRQPGTNSPGFPQRGSPWASVGLSSGLKSGEPPGQTRVNGPLRDL
ncbi:zinc-RING finger domain-containing protein [Trichoderma breve]|uniref:Zinc-RING finger domain-containing protein n=1 Tax=Trichoderma breve TaxID=2034170 RepID=A0A9W9E454_9HYPO|nr:zinc-RING finger domain-containing protein [Trichoderma breve]KAJ4857479.1 zinc-RING finger domain-containing protein [Trichoderma breve]